METANLEERKTYETSKRATSKIYCANCSFCVLVRQFKSKEGQYVLRVRCLKGMWKKKLGDEKLYKYFSVGRRTMDECDHYEDMGELKQYLKDLRKNLPVKDELYHLNPSDNIKKQQRQYN